MIYEIDFHGAALRELQKLPRSAFGPVLRSIIDLAKEPRPPGVKKLVGVDPPAYRVRVGDYRIVYAIDDDNHVIGIDRIAHRRDAYT